MKNILKINFEWVAVCMFLIMTSCGQNKASTEKQKTGIKFTIAELKGENNLGEIPIKLLDSLQLRKYLISLGKEKLNPRRDSAKPFSEGAIKEGFESLLGWGYSTATLNKCGKLLNLSPEDYEINSYGNSTVYSIDHITDSQALTDYLNVDVGAQFGFGFFGASAQSSYIRDHKMNSYTEYLVTKVQVRNQGIKLKNLRFDETLNSEYENDLNGFLNYSGNEVISEVITGGDLYIIYSFKSKSASDQKIIKESIEAHAKGILTSASFSSAMASISTNTMQNTEVNVQIIRNGDYTSLPDMSPKALIDYCLDFPRIVNSQSDKKTIVSFVTTPLKNIRGINREFINTKPIIAQQYYILKLARKKDEIDKALGNIQYVNENKLSFKDEDLKKGENLKTKYLGFIDELRKYADLAVNDFADLNCDLGAFKIENYEPVPTNTVVPQPTQAPVQNIVNLQGQTLDLLRCKPGEIYKVRVDGTWGTMSFNGGACYTADGIDINNQGVFNPDWECGFQIKYSDGKTAPFQPYKGEFTFDVPNAVLVIVPKINTGLCGGIGPNSNPMKAIYWKTN